MTIPTNHEDQVLLAGVLSYLRNADIPAVEPGYQKPNYWALPVVETAVIPVATGTGWTDVVSIAAQEEYQVVIKEYVATVVGAFPATGLRFRFVFDEALSRQGFSLTEGIDRHQNAATPPYMRMPVGGVLTSNDVLRLQVLNTTGVSQHVVGGLFGWQFYDPESPGERSVSVPPEENP